MADALLLGPPRLGDDPARVGGTLTEAFTQMREAVGEGRPVVVVVDDRDLLGQRGVADAALATGLLGLARAFALEGAREGWSVNTLTHRGEDVEDRARMLAASGLSGQLVRLGTDHLGRIWP